MYSVYILPETERYMELKPIEKTVTLKDKAYEAIKNAIYSNELKPGTALAEEQLSHMLSISRTPIRTALQQLVFEKLATKDSTGHIFVSSISKKAVQDMSVMRTALEPLSVEIAKFPIDEKVIERLKEIDKAQEKACKPFDINGYAELDCEFHCELASISGNSLLIETIRNINTTMIRYNILSGTLGTHTAVALEEHALIIKFLEEGNREFARTAVSEHVRNVSSRIIEDEDNKEETN